MIVEKAFEAGISLQVLIHFEATPDGLQEVSLGAGHLDCEMVSNINQIIFAFV